MRQQAASATACCRVGQHRRRTSARLPPGVRLGRPLAKKSATSGSVQGRPAASAAADSSHGAASKQAAASAPLSSLVSCTAPSLQGARPSSAALHAGSVSAAAAVLLLTPASASSMGCTQGSLPSPLTGACDICSCGLSVAWGSTAAGPMQTCCNASPAAAGAPASEAAPASSGDRQCCTAAADCCAFAENAAC